MATYEKAKWTKRTPKSEISRLESIIRTSWLRGVTEFKLLLKQSRVFSPHRTPRIEEIVTLMNTENYDAEQAIQWYFNKVAK